MTRASVRRSVWWTTIALAVAGPSLVAGSALGSSSAASQELRVLPETFPPVRLAAGMYRTRPGFNPVTTFTVGRGWNGVGSSRDWAVGQGWNPSSERGFRGAGILVSKLSLRYATAVARFRALKTLEAGPSKPIRVGGYRGVVFRAKVAGFSAIMPSVAPRVDVVNTPGGQQIFVNVRGITLLLRVEARASDAAAVQGFLRTVQFPR